MASNFNYDKKKGKIGEKAVADFFCSNGYTVIDVSENKDFQKCDIDLIVDNEYIEIKTQNSINRNNKITLELCINYYNNFVRNGWFKETEATTLVFYDKHNNTAYHIDTNELRKIYEQYEDRIEKYYYDEDYKECTLAYVDIDFLKQKSKTLRIFNYNSLTA